MKIILSAIAFVLIFSGIYYQSSRNYVYKTVEGIATPYEFRKGYVRRGERSVLVLEMKVELDSGESFKTKLAAPDLAKALNKSPLKLKECPKAKVVVEVEYTDKKITDTDIVYKEWIPCEN